MLSSTVSTETACFQKASDQRPSMVPAGTIQFQIGVIPKASCMDPAGTVWSQNESVHTGRGTVWFQTGVGTVPTGTVWFCKGVNSYSPIKRARTHTHTHTALRQIPNKAWRARTQRRAWIPGNTYPPAPGLSGKQGAQLALWLIGTCFLTSLGVVGGFLWILLLITKYC